MLLLSPQLLDQTLNIAYQAGTHLNTFYQQSKQHAVDVHTKSDNTPVTDVDLFLSQFLIEKLTALTPNVPILSEECCHVPLSERARWEEYWLIDPLDGTQQFICQTDQFSVLITLVQHNTPVLSVIHAPMLDATYYAMQHFGAYKRSSAGVQKLTCGQPSADRPLKIALGASCAIEKVRSILNPNYQYEFVIYGSSGLKSGLVAEGSCDCYVRLGKTGEWDTAGAEILLAEIGGNIFNTQFQPLTYNQRETFTNPDFVMTANCQYNWREIFQFR
ncbi:3'(2'),5'-bisphosphate nucleotidase CysQ [Pasteurella sp. PK-2025]|uniref:3'(2'),5'-bisphosphate nucleotidase CysQ n=1 Tax=Pasteurella sp. PK-2025 TaxID=3413133 RepID=UPI003C787872